MTQTQTPAIALPLLPTAFPDYDVSTLPPIPADWTDNSWKNDTCPCFHAGGEAAVFVDYLERSDREYPAGARFSALALDDGQFRVGGREEIYYGDDWGALLAAVETHQRQTLAAQYLDRIGYDPFTDDPTITVAEVRQTLKEHAEAASA